MSVTMHFSHSAVIFRPRIPMVNMNPDFDWRNRSFVEWDQPEYKPPGHGLVSWADVFLRQDSGPLTILVEDFDSPGFTAAASSSEGGIDIVDPLGASNVTAETWVEVFTPGSPGRFRMRIWSDEDPLVLHIGFRLETPFV